MEEQDKNAIERLKAALSKPDLPDDSLLGGERHFDPWSDLLPVFYGTYDGDFDACAIQVLEELRDENFMNRRRDLGAEMFREVLCTSGLCTYGTSPRGCFPEAEFRPLLSDLVEKWKRFALVQWGEEVWKVAK